jgi:LAO/AO transport system kinase
MKAGLMEIADIFAVNKADRPEADLFVRNLRLMLAPAFATNTQEIPVVKTIATEQNGADELLHQIQVLLKQQHTNNRKSWLLAEKAYFLIQQQRMKDVLKKEMKKSIEEEMKKGDFNLYRFVQKFN